MSFFQANRDSKRGEVDNARRKVKCARRFIIAAIICGIITIITSTVLGIYLEKKGDVENTTHI